MLKIILLTAAMSTGCVPKLKTLKSFDDGSMQVSVPDLGVQLRVPGDSLLTGTASWYSIIQWAGNARGIRIEKRSTKHHDSAEALSSDLGAARTEFSVEAAETFATGFDVTFSHRPGVTQMFGYEAEVKVGETIYGCYLTSGTDMASVAVAKAACRSIVSSAK